MACISNAAVAVARVGESGKGVAVVAEGARNPVRRSAQTVQDESPRIKLMIFA